MGDEFAVEEQQIFAPFTLEDATEDTSDNVCMLCVHRDTCPIIIYVNKLSMKRDGKTLDDEFNCPAFAAEEHQENQV